MARQIYQVKVSLADVAPPVWRRVQVPAAYTLDRVHRAIQHAMGWMDFHLHSFDIDGIQYGEPDPEGELMLRDELEVRLDAVAAKGSRFLYTYDFGDWWEHDVLVEDVFTAEPDERYPACVAGERACPPEDVGGAFGYAELLLALRDPGHPQHEPTRALVPAAFDPERFEPDRATTLLRRLA
jgi:hypothetical protein